MSPLALLNIIACFVTSPSASAFSSKSGFAPPTNFRAFNISVPVLTTSTPFMFIVSKPSATSSSPCKSAPCNPVNALNSLKAVSYSSADSMPILVIAITAPIPATAPPVTSPPVRASPIPLNALL